MAKYWETEQPVTVESEKNVVRVYNEASKIQVYPKATNAPRGIGRGATIDLECMDIEQLESLREVLNTAIDEMVERL